MPESQEVQEAIRRWKIVLDFEFKVQQIIANFNPSYQGRPAQDLNDAIQALALIPAPKYHEWDCRYSISVDGPSDYVLVAMENDEIAYSIASVNTPSELAVKICQHIIDRSKKEGWLS